MTIVTNKYNIIMVDVICTANCRTFICLFALPTFTFVSEVHLFVYSHGKLTDRALICLYARQILTDNPLINVKFICLLICTSKMRIGKYVLYFIHKNKVFTVNLDFRVDLSMHLSYVNSTLKNYLKKKIIIIYSLRQEFVSKQVQVQLSRYCKPSGTWV